MKAWVSGLGVLVLAGCARGAWLSSTQPGFTSDETICRIAGDRTNAAALVGATGTLWQAFDAHNHDGRYDPAGAAGGVSNALLLVIGAHNHDGRYDLFGAANAVSNALGAVVDVIAAAFPTSIVFAAQQAGVLYQLDSNAWIVPNQGTGVLFTVTLTPTAVTDYSRLVVQQFWGQFDCGGQTPQGGDILTGTPGTGPWSISYGDGSSVSIQGDGAGGWWLTTAWADQSYWGWGPDPVQAGWFDDPNWQWGCSFVWGTSTVIMPVTNTVNLATAADTGAVLEQEQADVASLQGQIDAAVSQEQVDVSALGTAIVGSTQALITAVQGTNIAMAVSGLATQGMITAAMTTNLITGLIAGRAVAPAWTNCSATGVWPKIVALVISAFAAMGYTVSRTAVKNG